MPRTKKKRKRGRPRQYNDILHDYWREQKRAQRLVRKELTESEKIARRIAEIKKEKGRK